MVPPVALPLSSAPPLERSLAQASAPRVPRAARPLRLGLVVYCFNIAAKNSSKLPDVPHFSDPLVYIREAKRLRAGAVQIPFPVSEREKLWEIRDLAEQSGIVLETTLGLPKSDPDLDRFDAELKFARDLGIKVARTVLLPGRRYEQFRSVLDYANEMTRATKALSDAEKFARRYDVKLALENHKDQTTEERLALLEQFSSEYIGACFDIGNNIALLEDPVAAARAFAPWTLTVHFKDQGVREYPEGFLLADVPVGQGAIDLAAVINIIRAKKPEVLFHLELITRDALRIPIYRDDYWATLDAIRAPHLAETLALLKKRSAPNDFPVISTLPAAEQVRIERANIEESFRYSADHLGFSL